MADNLSKEVRSRNMSAIRSTNTKLENRFSKALWHKGIRFRRNVKSLYGKPDIAIKKYKLVIFIDSCFWHGCKLHCRIPNTNREFWENKIMRNRLRDQEVSEYYSRMDWNIVRIWEHSLKLDFEYALEKVSYIIMYLKYQGLVKGFDTKNIK
ncbi:very short patch repair endonuclease [Tumebacillus flagellatus]|uniref:Very short patch repair endonuclease n=1 Tax=Tumebacillus flagellatus TaxID=1157490 RepID=A0A074LXH9_9BACL|nr:very short patch repair endonuclease [Tumebacillus flagellatus]KEO85120.1 DNA mismatch repair protein Vsr [Tumebacillus flagellatus]